MTKLDESIQKEISNIENNHGVRWTTRDQDYLVALIRRWSLPMGLDEQKYDSLFKEGAVRTAANRAYIAGETTFPAKESPEGTLWVRKEHLPYAIKNASAINTAILKGEKRYRALGPKGFLKDEKLLPPEKVGLVGKSVTETEIHPEKGENYYAGRRFITKEPIGNQFYYTCSIGLIYEIIISPFPDLDTNPRPAPSSAILFASENEATVYLRKLRSRGGVNLEDLQPFQFDEIARKIVDRNFEGIDKVAPDFSLVVRVCQISKMKPIRKNTAKFLTNRIWPILRNTPLFDGARLAEEDVQTILVKLCSFPNQSNYKKLGENGAYERVKVLASALELFLRHFKGDEEHLIPGWRPFLEQLNKQFSKFISDWVAEKKLLKAKSFEVLDLTLVKKTLDHFAEERLDLYHWSILALASGMRIDEIDRFITDPNQYVVEDGFILDSGKVVEKIDTDKRCEMPLVALIIYRNLDKFPVKGFHASDLDLRGSQTNIRNALKREGVDFYRRRYRTTCSSMLARCQNDSRLHPSVSYLTIIERGAWIKEQTARDHYIKTLPGVGIVSDVYFSLREPEDRIYLVRKETIKKIVGEAVVEDLVDREFDLLEGQNAWDAWLLRHFIRTHQKHIELDHMHCPPEAQSEANLKFLELVFEWQERIFKRTGRIRKHDAGVANVIQLLNEGHLIQAEACLETVIEKVDPNRLVYKRIVRELLTLLEDKNRSYHSGTHHHARKLELKDKFERLFENPERNIEGFLDAVLVDDPESA